MPVKFITELIRGLFGTSETSSDSSAETETNITVERETGEESGDGTDDDSTATEERPTEAAEEESPGGEPSDDESSEEESSGDEPSGDGSAADEPATEAAEDTAAPGADDPVGEITGIGPTYSERLSEIGIETVADLAGADAAEVSEAAQVSESRAADWITQAEDW